jgi:hypothetical protein
MNQVNAVAVNQLLSLHKDCFPTINWPTIKSRTGKLKSAIKSYCDEDERLMEFHVCPKLGCTAFVGDYSKDISCKKCGAHRFRSCTNPYCSQKKYEECGHAFKNRVSHKSLFYRPITSLIRQLLGTNGFIHAIRYSFQEKTKNFKYYDCSDGSTYKGNLDNMKHRYNAKFEQYEDVEKPVMINILFGQWYDGCDIYKNKNVNFWPLNAVILNLPPSYRIKLGIGMFLISIFTGIMKSNAEDFFLRNLLVAELKSLCDGIDMEINKTHYFVQARMIITMLDTKAVEDFLKVQTSNSFAGCCMCHHGKGYNREVFMCYCGHRNLLAITHYLRSFGQSGHCCPKNYYDMNRNIELEHVNNVQGVKRCNLPKVKNETMIVCDMANSQQIYNFLSSKKTQWTWEFPEVDLYVFEKHLFYHHADYRPYVEYERKSNKFYLENGEKARENRRKTNRVKAINGVHDTWAMSELGYCDITRDICWGPMHTLMNIASNIIVNWKGERPKGPKIIQYCRKTGMHPDMHNLETKKANKKKKKKLNHYEEKIIRPQKWNINKRMQDKVN